MPRAPIPFQPAYVLRALPYRDTSLLVEAFTPLHGRIGVVARGARGPKARLRVLLQAFQPLLLSWSESGDLGSLTAAEANGPALVLAGEQVFSGWYLNELLLRLLTRHDPHPEIFEAYHRALHALPGEGADALRQFEIGLLAELGFGLDLPEDLNPEQAYRYDSGRGAQPVLASDPGAISGLGLLALRDGLRVPAPDRRAARDLLRGLIEPLLGGKPLATTAMLRELRDPAGGGR